MKKLIIIAGIAAVGIYLMNKKSGDKTAATGNPPATGGTAPGNTATNPIVPAGIGTTPTTTKATNTPVITPVTNANNSAALKTGDQVLYNNFKWKIVSIVGDIARLERGTGIAKMKVSAKLNELFKA